MKHSLNVNVSNAPVYSGIVSCKSIPIKNRYLKKLMGNAEKMLVIIPGDSVTDITIQEKDEGVIKDVKYSQQEILT